MQDTHKSIWNKQSIVISLFIAFNLIFLVPLAISVLEIGKQSAASLSAAEFLGFKKEPYDLYERAGIDQEANIDIIDAFVYRVDEEKVNLTAYYAEQERATLRDMGYPTPYYVYIPALVIVLYLVIYLLISKRMKGPLYIKILPLIVVTTICISVYWKRVDPYSVINYFRNDSDLSI